MSDCPAKDDGAAAAAGGGVSKRARRRRRRKGAASELSFIGLLLAHSGLGVGGGEGRLWWFSVSRSPSLGPGFFVDLAIISRGIQNEFGEV